MHYNINFFTLEVLKINTRTKVYRERYYMPSKELEREIKKYDKYIERRGVDDQVVDALVAAVNVCFHEPNADIEYAKQYSSRVKGIINQEIVKATNGGNVDKLDEYCTAHNVQAEYLNQYYECVRNEAPYLFNSYLNYLERNRQEKDKFYKPRRKCFRRMGIIQALQALEDDKLDLLSLSMPPGTGKTTIEKFFMSWVIGRDLEGFSLFFSHSGDITRMFYDGILDITTNSQEYTWNQIFPKATLQATNAKAETINFGKYKPFSSIQCTSVGAKNAGKVRASKYLLGDDFIGGIEEALNKNILDKLWNIYTVDARQRMLDGCKELHLATRWSVHDIIGRLQILHEGNKRAKFIAYPDIDPATGKSNFAYDINGFSEKFFHEQEEAMDEVSYRCLYKNEPIEREGLLYHSDELRRYLTLPEQEPDAILAVCDTKNKGVDYMVMPVCYVYGEDHYMVDCICDDSSDYNYQEKRLAEKICDHNMQRCEFESNAGGDRLAKNVTDRVKALKGRCSITTKPTETNKETRIIVNSNWVKEHFVFKDESLYAKKSDYGRFMNMMLTYSVAGKNPHDDVPDALANYSLFVTKPERKAARIMKNFL